MSRASIGVMKIAWAKPLLPDVQVTAENVHLLAVNVPVRRITSTCFKFAEDDRVAARGIDGK